MGEPEIVVVLVHGTYARRSRRFESSVLVGALTDTFGTAVDVASFNWSGRNRFKDRKRGANELAEYLQALADRYPGARLFVVAHSHGGNVALHAIRLVDADARVDGLVCIATPFLHA